MITGYGDGYVEINQVPYAHAVLLSSNGAISEWPAKSFDHLEASHFAQMVDLKPELILIGTGNRQRFPKPELLKALISAKIGFEIMDSQAVIRPAPWQDSALNHHLCIAMVWHDELSPPHPIR